MKNNSCKLLIIKTLLFFLYVNQASAIDLDSVSKKKKREFHLIFGSGFTYAKTRDQAMSPMLYRGGGIGGKIGFQKVRFWDVFRRSLLEINYNLAIIKPKNYPEISSSKAKFTNIRLDYSHFRHLKDFKNYQLQIGGNWVNAFTLRNHELTYNNNLNADFLSTINLAALLQRTFLIKKRKLNIGNDFGFSLFGVVLRPSWASSVPEGFIKGFDNNFKAAIQSVKVVPFYRLPYLQYGLNANYPLKNGNAFRFSYLWDFYDYKHFNHVVNVTHRIQFNLLFKL